MPARAFDDLVRTITGDQPPRVWSLLVTVFGDLAQQEGARIGGPTLNRLTELMGIKPEATRVALHRLRKDGWIDSRRAGRSSTYGLTAWGRKQSAAASPRIYATGPLAESAWLVLTDPREGAERPGAVQVSPCIWIDVRRPDDDGVFSAEIAADTGLPDWMSAKVCDAGTCSQSQDVSIRCAELLKQLGSSPELSQPEAAALRVLTVHGWRRLALKAPALPDFVFPNGWHGPQCRSLVAELLAALPAPPLSDLERAAQADRAA
ncbi:PaaX family transcriptional regulator C-terminal domain-containing protein [Sulfitobacter sp. D35]|uniref:PaaX family transcriptional regulator C-terminal domain-containing protein n=1 Tax=Sulfitobacter sp. D35 TaxID=3083252 RepID=UPI00296EF36F|nr:PaaX family transcriptional regulator C-terminal domain-containing protein [Sulfitobacter sp. D35]MDW4496448.1 PaaX family transcriptional regulator C-terminal domain-containing protein [Sulfitobacter sp. D35]